MARSPGVLLALLVLAVSVPPASRAQSGGLTVPAGFTIERIATVPDARELVVAPNGDLLVGTLGSSVIMVADAQGTPAPPAVFTWIEDAPVAGIALDGNRMVLGSQFGVWDLPFRTGQRTTNQRPRKIGPLRTSGQPRGHRTTSVAVVNGTTFASVGSSCDACDPELDVTRASILEFARDDSALAPAARHLRNAIALGVNPATGTVWAGNAGQDQLPPGHPYEIFDGVTLHPGPADYGWPHCYDNRMPVDGSSICANVVVPRVVFPAYSTPIGVAFYPLHPSGAHAFPDVYRGGAFVTLHGSWHRPPVPPRVVFVPMSGDTPRTPVDWHDPSKQWREFVGGFQTDNGTRIARPTGIAIGPDGSLFFSTDESRSAVYRVRPKP